MIELSAAPEPWLDKKGLAEYLACSVRSIELAIVDGLPWVEIMGRKKFRASQVEEWLEANGRLIRHGGGTIEGNGNWPAGAVNADEPRQKEGLIPDAGFKS
jgi:hypothetical protein